MIASALVAYMLSRVRYQHHRRATRESVSWVARGGGRSRCPRRRRTRGAPSSTRGLRAGRPVPGRGPTDGRGRVLTPEASQGDTASPPAGRNHVATGEQHGLRHDGPLYDARGRVPRAALRVSGKTRAGYRRLLQRTVHLPRPVVPRRCRRPAIRPRSATVTKMYPWRARAVRARGAAPRRRSRLSCMSTTVSRAGAASARSAIARARAGPRGHVPAHEVTPRPPAARRPAGRPPVRRQQQGGRGAGRGGDRVAAAPIWSAIPLGAAW